MNSLKGIRIFVRDNFEDIKKNIIHQYDKLENNIVISDVEELLNIKSSEWRDWNPRNELVNLAPHDLDRIMLMMMMQFDDNVIPHENEIHHENNIPQFAGTSEINFKSLTWWLQGTKRCNNLSKRKNNVLKVSFMTLWGLFSAHETNKYLDYFTYKSHFQQNFYNLLHGGIVTIIFIFINGLISYHINNCDYFTLIAKLSIIIILMRYTTGVKFITNTHQQRLFLDFYSKFVKNTNHKKKFESFMHMIQNTQDLDEIKKYIDMNYTSDIIFKNFIKNITSYEIKLYILDVDKLYYVIHDKCDKFSKVWCCLTDKFDNWDIVKRHYMNEPIIFNKNKHRFTEMLTHEQAMKLM
uniref:Uncharacterized protein n=1 Tax=Megaviridae environmental sample TaxID=1737588 RepID=A0A5J6VIA1_9VIRU|nr:MAG: hypothetical protein [Megaviridae environmental sample]